MNYIYIVNKKGKPLMPTTRQSHIRRLIKAGKAVVINGNPFTVRLKYETPDITQPIYAGMDTGRENIGLACSLEDGTCVYRAEVETHNKSVHKEMENRKVNRHERKRHNRDRKQRKAIKEHNDIRNGQDDVLKHRKACKSVEVRYPGAKESVTCKAIHGKESRFANRKRKEGWLTPSARQLIQMHVLALERILEILPVSNFSLESVKFDFQKLENDDIKDWQHGPLFGYKDYKAYIRDIQNGKCLLCGNGRIDEFHHIVPRSKGGSDTVRNIAGLCRKCHHELSGVHKSEDASSALAEIKEGERKKYRVSLLNSIMPYLIETFEEITLKRGIDFTVTNGYETFETREKYGIPKGHDYDAYAISLFEREVNNITISENRYVMRRFKKKSNNMINANGCREYYLDGKLVAVNRHKAESQTTDSLEEFRDKYSERAVSRLVVKPAKRVYTYHKEGKVPHVHPGDVVKYEKHNKIKGNTKREVFVADRVVLGKKERVCHNGTKEKRLKYCKRIRSGCLQYV